LTTTKLFNHSFYDIFSWWSWSLSENPWTTFSPEKSFTFWTLLSRRSGGRSKNPLSK
jgi:hypothetical protein